MSSAKRHPAWWIPTLYFAEGLPYAVITGTGLMGVAFLRLGFSPAETAAYTSSLYLPWVIKPLWAPLLERFSTRRAWILAMQAAGALLVIPLALTIADKSWLPLTLSLLVSMGVASATHDIAADGFYIEALSEKHQAEWSGVRNTFYRVANLAGTGGLVWLAGKWEKDWGNPAAAWSAIFGVVAVIMGLLAAYHYFAIPKLDGGIQPAARPGWREWAGDILRVWLAFLQKPDFWRILAFILFYRFAEAQVQSANKAFFLAQPADGGLGLDTKEVGGLYGTLGVIALMAGGILGGLAIARTGLRRQLWLMAAAMNLPNILYIYMAWAQPQSRVLIGGIIGIEQFGYGFGFAAFMVYLLYVARGPHATAHYAICSGLMALGFAIGGETAAAALAQTANLPHGGYLEFFAWVMACTLVSFAVLWKLPLEKDFGRRETTFRQN
jgi:PAT family beta-lactamase induction signal transducer AmpG